MSIEGDRFSAGLFNPGDALSAGQLNDLSAFASRGNQYFSAGQQVAQGPFGTIDLSARDIQPYDPDQFTVTVQVDSENVPWFSIVPGFCTVVDHICRMMADGNGVVSVGSSDVQKNEAGGYANLYKVDSCNAFGMKRDLDKTNKLSENQFTPETTEWSSGKVIVFLYRSTPGYGTPKLAVVTEGSFGLLWQMTETYKTPGPGTIPCTWAGFERPLGSVPQISYKSFGAGSGNWQKLGLHVQVLAYYDKGTKVLTQVKKGHVEMDCTPVTITKSNSDSTKVDYCDGWQSYFYTGTRYGVTFETP